MQISSCARVVLNLQMTGFGTRKGLFFQGGVILLRCLAKSAPFTSCILRKKYLSCFYILRSAIPILTFIIHSYIHTYIHKDIHVYHIYIYI
jgi:hypothetical protein